MPRVTSIEKTRNVGLIGSVEEGLTQLTVRILSCFAQSQELALKDDVAATKEWAQLKQDRRIVISPSTTGTWKSACVNLPETPLEVFSRIAIQPSFRVLDGAITFVSTHGGLLRGERTMLRRASKAKIPRIGFIYNMDSEGASIENCIRDMKPQVDATLVVMQLPIGVEGQFIGVIDLLKNKMLYFNTGSTQDGSYREEVITEEYSNQANKARALLLDEAAKGDDNLTEKRRRGEEIESQLIQNALRKRTLNLEVMPLFCGSVTQNIGISNLVDAVIDYLPAPNHYPAIQGKEIAGDTTVTRKSTDEEPFSAVVFQIIADAFGSNLTFVRVFSGMVSTETGVKNTTKGTSERISRIMRMTSSGCEDVKELYCGDIGALIGLNEPTIGDTLSDESNAILFETIVYPEPLVSISIEAKNKSDQVKIETTLTRLAKEIPGLKLSPDKEAGRTILAGRDEIQLESVIDRMKNELGVDVTREQPEVIIRESILQGADAEFEQNQQVDGIRQYAKVAIHIEPLEEGESGFKFQNNVSGGAIPDKFVNATRKGIEEAMASGVLIGSPTTNLEVTLKSGSYREGDSSELAFQIAGSTAMRTALQDAEPILLEPTMRVVVETPGKDAMGVQRAAQGLLGTIEEYDQMDDEWTKLVVDIPVSQLSSFGKKVEHETSAYATYTVDFKTYSRAPHSVEEEIIKSRGRKE